MNSTTVLYERFQPGVSHEKVEANFSKDRSELRYLTEK